MAKYYVDFVGLNTFIYEPVGFSVDEQISTNDVVGKETIQFNDGGSESDRTLTQNIFGYTAGTSYAYLKNHRFSHDLSTTASFFPALMLRRNGPYGWPAYKSMRLSHNPLIRQQKKNNKMSIMLKPKPKTFVLNGKVRNIFPRKGDLALFDEPGVVARHHPLEYSFGLVEDFETSYGLETTRMRRIRVKHSFDNLLYMMSNKQINETSDIPNSYLELYDPEEDSIPTQLEEYHGITGLYIDGAIDDPNSPIDEFLFLRYRSTVFPPERYTFKKYTRGRTTFTFKWRDSLANRQETAGDGFSITSGRERSIWPLDVDPDWQNFTAPFIKYMGVDTTSSFGILWNNYAQASEGLQDSGIGLNFNDRVRPAPIYARRHMMPFSQSVVSPSGLIEVTGASDFNNTIAGNELVSGEAYWDAPSQAPSSSGPFYDSYDEYAKDIRLIGKNYSIIPEFRISEFVEEYQDRAVDDPLNNFLSINGGLTGHTDSTTKKFYDVFTTTDLMKSFDFVVDDHEGFAEPARLSITCKAISKFLPYDGFYPVQRSVELSKQFYNSYKDNISYQSASSGVIFGGSTLSERIHQSFQNILAPLAAPGVLYNSIKSGIACDFPIVTGSLGGTAAATSLDDKLPIQEFTQRIPFEAIVQPHKYLANIILPGLDYHGSGSYEITSSWDGGGDQLYAKMANNFLGEVPNFFLDGATNSAIASKKNKDIFFVKENTTYAMRVEMFRTMTGPRPYVTNSVGVDYRVPQDITDGVVKESLTMYSRPSAFGPPTQGYVSGIPNVDPLFETIGPKVTSATLETNSGQGFNYPYTPPYYHGRAWADIVYKSGGKTGRVQLDEIIASSSVTYHRFDPTIYSNNGYDSASVWTTAQGPQAITRLNDNAMQVSASLNLFGFAQVGEFNEAVVENRENARWVIQTKFETPILNFAKYENLNTITTSSNDGKYQIPRGMWHQFGEIPTGLSGIYMKVGDVPNSWNVAHGRPRASGHVTSSLSDLCGFDTTPVKLGKIAESITVKEAVVMIPYKEVSGEKQFFKIEETTDLAKVTIATAKKMAAGIETGQIQAMMNLEQPGRSVVEMVRKMQEFVIPPQMDFVSYPDSIDPFSMYIFDFEYTFTREDLQYIWQGLMPPSAQKHEMLNKSVRHKLMDNELLNSKDLVDNPNIKWIVFKAKQRANTNYFDKIYLQAGQSNFERQQPQGTISAIPESIKIEGKPNKAITYNWPYDFFSFIELVKVDNAVTFKGKDPDSGKEIKVTRDEGAVRRSNLSTPKVSRPFSGD